MLCSKNCKAAPWRLHFMSVSVFCWCWAKVPCKKRLKSYKLCDRWFSFLIYRKLSSVLFWQSIVSKIRSNVDFQTSQKFFFRTFLADVLMSKFLSEDNEIWLLLGTFNISYWLANWNRALEIFSKEILFARKWRSNKRSSPLTGSYVK